jgi:phosphotransacetylase
VPHSHAAAAKAVELIRASKGELLMKGNLHTDELMREMTSSASGLRTERRISHVFILERPRPSRCRCWNQNGSNHGKLPHRSLRSIRTIVPI